MHFLEVKCPFPSRPDNGFVNYPAKQTLYYKDKATYGCHDTYVLDGPQEVECNKSGNWSAQPSCKGMRYGCGLHTSWIYPVDCPHLPFFCSNHFLLVAQTPFTIIGMWRTLGLTWARGSFVLSKLVWDETVGDKQTLCKHWSHGGGLYGFPVRVLFRFVRVQILLVVAKTNHTLKASSRKWGFIINEQQAITWTLKVRKWNTTGPPEDWKSGPIATLSISQWPCGLSHPHVSLLSHLKPGWLWRTSQPKTYH